MLDRFVFDPDRKTGELTLNVTQGMFRFVTGGMQKEAYRIRTPHATIGVRGTDFLLRVTATETSVAVIDGTVLMASLLPGAQGSAVPAGNAARNAAGGIQVSPIPAGAAGSESRTQDGSGRTSTAVIARLQQAAGNRLNAEHRKK